jgi:hypothetical protein
MTRIFLDESQIEELDNFDIYEDLEDIFTEEPVDEDDWFGVDDPEISRFTIIGMVIPNGWVVFFALTTILGIKLLS